MRNMDWDMDPMSPSTGDVDGGDLARTFDCWSPASAPDPYPLFRPVRADCPVARSDELEGFYILSRYEDVNCPARSRHLHLHRDDGAGHTGRGTPPGPLEAVARDTARRLAAACTGRIEAYMSYCFPMPSVVISQIPGVNATDDRRFEEWIASTVDGQGVDPGAALDASAEIHEYLAALLARRQHEPCDDLLSFLLTADVDGELLSDAERLGIAQLLLIAGIDTTANTLAHALHYLSEDASWRRHQPHRRHDRRRSV